jgi:hypothetical protein
MGEDAGQAASHFEHNPLSRCGTYHATPIRKLNDPARSVMSLRGERPGAGPHEGPQADQHQSS